jgi:hypothetical protein
MSAFLEVHGVPNGASLTSKVVLGGSSSPGASAASSATHPAVSVAETAVEHGSEVVTLARWELVPEGDGTVLMRDGRRIVTVGGAREFAEDQLNRYRDQERQAHEALESDKPLSLCDLGWHRGVLPRPVASHLGTLSLYFRFVAKSSEAGGTLVYLMGEEQFEYLARTAKCLGNLNPWFCSVCDRPIGPDEYS